MVSEPSIVTRDDIQRRLRDLEIQYDVRIVYACEAGSRAYGLSHAKSDYDIRFLFVRRTEAYLTVQEPTSKSHVIAQAVEGMWDITGWDVRKALQLLRDSNPTLLEWLHSSVVYIGANEDGTAPIAVVASMREIAAKYLSLHACKRHYYSWLRKTCKNQAMISSLSQKKILCLLRLVLAIRWLLKRKSIVPILFPDLVNGAFDENILAEQVIIKESLSLAEHHRQGRDLKCRNVITKFIEVEVKRFESEKFGKRDSEKISYSALDVVLREAINSGWG